MLTHDPDITRLLDRLELGELVVRNREQKDRRVIVTRITRAGKDLLRDVPAAELASLRVAEVDGALDQVAETKGTGSAARRRRSTVPPGRRGSEGSRRGRISWATCGPPRACPRSRLSPCYSNRSA